MNSIGRLRHFDAVYHLNTKPYGNTWRGQREKAGGGALLDMGYHTVDLLVSYFGMPSVVRATEIAGRTGEQSLGVEETITAILEYESGLVGRMFLSRCESKKYDCLTVTGTQGAVEVRPGSYRQLGTGGEELETFNVTPAWPKGVGDVLEAFVASMGNRATALEECSRGLQAMALTTALYDSMERGVTVRPERVDLGAEELVRREAS